MEIKTDRFYAMRFPVMLWLLIGAVFVLSACGPAASAPTPTPTKTPATAEQSAAPAATQPPAVAEAPTATPEPPTPTPEPPTPTPMPANISPFTGLTVDDPARLDLRPIFVCVNNDSVGRSAHYGLTAADLVYEYIVDGF
ncbi:MAG: DUF3048 domain-containing protein, partial [Caldilineaceae bacterium]|nr:DUF3048 domain-containing protein [Caldilineaceae bacterium]